jgi:hypothetical protein
MADALVADRVASTLVAGYGLAGGFELGAALPFIVAGGESEMTGAPVPDGAALGDLVLGARVRLARPLAVGAEVSCPPATRQPTPARPASARRCARRRAWISAVWRWPPPPG